MIVKSGGTEWSIEVSEIIQIALMIIGGAVSTFLGCGAAYWVATRDDEDGGSAFCTVIFGFFLLLAGSVWICLHI